MTVKKIRGEREIERKNLPVIGFHDPRRPRWLYTDHTAFLQSKTRTETHRHQHKHTGAVPRRLATHTHQQKDTGVAHSCVESQLSELRASCDSPLHFRERRGTPLFHSLFLESQPSSVEKHPLTAFSGTSAACDIFTFSLSHSRQGKTVPKCTESKSNNRTAPRLKSCELISTWGIEGWNCSPTQDTDQLEDNWGCYLKNGLT